MEKTPSRKARGRPKTVDRERTIRLAMENYWVEGLHALSLNQLCVRTEISKPALYREFENEDGLMDAVLSLYRQTVVVPLLAFLHSDGSFAQVLDQILVAMTTNDETPVGCLFTQMRLSGTRLGPKTAARVRALEQERCDAFEAWYQRALADDAVDVSVEPKLAAGYIDTQFTSMLVQAKAGTPPDAIRAQARLAFRVLSRQPRMSQR